MAWPANPSSAVAPGPAQAQDFSMSNMGIALSPGMVMVPSPTSTTGSSWSFVSGLPSASVTPVFGPLPDSDSEYTFVHAPTESGVSTTEVARHAPLHPAGRAGRPTANTAKVARGNRRAVSKQKKSIVPSSYTERQEKSTVSRRRGPLTHEKREKAAKMRKGDRRNCIRCKMYKVGVCYASFGSPHMLTFLSATREILATNASSLGKTLDSSSNNAVGII